MLDSKGISIPDWFYLENENAFEEIDEEYVLKKRKYHE